MEIDITELKRKFPYELGPGLKYLETIDHGAFGTVLHVLDLASNEDMAVKVINKNSLSGINKMKEEISILRKLNHPNIVKFFGYTETNNQLLIKMEYIKFGTLKFWIKQKEKISEEESSIILSKVLSAIEYLHSKQITHRDIKPENIMLSKKNDLESIKIIDFGLSTQSYELLINNDYCGTYIYMAPELIEKKLYFSSVDIWSIGILMYILLNKGKHPFYSKGDTEEEIARKIKEGKINFNEKISPMAKHLIMKLLEPNPSWRYTASQAMKHPWITRNINDIPPATFNELLYKSNNKKIMKDLFNTCLFMNYFLKEEKFNFLIDKAYIKNCTYYSEKNKNKLIKKREACLDIENSEEKKSSSSSENSIEQNLNELRTREKSYSFNSRNRSLINQFQKKHKINLFKNGFKSETTNKENNIASLLKKYRIKKFKQKNLQFQCQKITLINNNINTNTNRIIKLEKSPIHNSMKNLNFMLNKNRNIEINEELINDKSNDEVKIKSNNKYKVSKNFFGYLSNRKLKNNLPKIGHIKKINLFQKKPSFALNTIDNYNIFPIILPNFRNISNNFKNSEIVRVKTLNKMRILNK